MGHFSWRLICLAALGLVALPGCFWNDWVQAMGWEGRYRGAFSTLNPEEEGIAQVDVATLRCRRGEALVDGELWTELDEQFLPIEKRKALAEQGIRVGVLHAACGSRLQAVIADPANAADKPSQDLINWMVKVGEGFVPAPKFAPLCRVEARRVTARAEMSLFWPVGRHAASARLLLPAGERGAWRARDLEEVDLGFALQLQKSSDGLTQLRLVPLARFAQGRRQDLGDVFLDTLRRRNSLPNNEERLEELALEVALGNDQYLVISMLPAVEPPDQACTWGELAFADPQSDQQIVLVIRGASVHANRLPEPPKKGQAWPLAWQAAEMTQSAKPR
jgi:hypothetical protein